VATEGTPAIVAFPKRAVKAASETSFLDMEDHQLYYNIGAI
jgi:hypothetical protein